MTRVSELILSVRLDRLVTKMLTKGIRNEQISYNLICMYYYTYFSKPSSGCYKNCFIYFSSDCGCVKACVPYKMKQFTH